MVVDKAIEAANELRLLVANLNEKMAAATQMGISIDISIEEFVTKEAGVHHEKRCPLVTLDMAIQL